MLKGYLTGMLSKELIDRGYTLVEDEDFLYLHLEGKLIGKWSTNGVKDIADIEQFIKGGL